MARQRLRGYRFVYDGDGTTISADYMNPRRLPKAIPAYDTIALKMRKPRRPEHAVTVYMRPDEAIAAACALAAAAWRAVTRGHGA